LVARLASDVDFLINRKFPLGWTLRRPIKDGLSEQQLEERERDLQEIENYRVELWKMPDGDFADLLAIERLQATFEYEAKVKREEQQRFFNAPGANADFVYWSKVAFWTLDEAIALSFGKNPKVVSWDKLKSLTEVSPFARNYSQLRELALRAVQVKQLQPSEWPAAFLAWAKRMDISYPEALEQNVASRSAAFLDWKALFEQMKKGHDEFVTAHEKYVETANAAVKQVKADRDTARAALQEKTQQLAELSAFVEGSPSLSTKERDSLLKLVIAMAVRGYKYKPAAAKNSATQEIAEDLIALGLTLDVDTIRKWLREGSQMLPSDFSADDKG
jgi:hypothetical protein